MKGEQKSKEKNMSVGEVADKKGIQRKKSMRNKKLKFKKLFRERLISQIEREKNEIEGQIEVESHF